MSAPLTPPDCDLRGLPFMPLDVVRLVDSDLFALSTGDEFKAAVVLWCKAWLQIPAASLPDDDRILAHLSGAGSRWRKLREMALRGFVKCDDGRLYHPVIADKALDAWDRRGEWEEKRNNKTERQQRWRARVKEISERLRQLGCTPPRNASLDAMERLLVDAEASTRRSTVDGLDRDRDRDSYSVDKSTGADAPPDPDRKFWSDAKSYLSSSGVKNPGGLVGKWVGEHGKSATAKAITAAQIERAVDPIPFIQACFRGEKERADAPLC